MTDKKKKDDDKSKTEAEHLFKSRMLAVTGQVDMDMAKKFVNSLLALAEASSDPVTVIVTSPGGHVEAGDLIHDMIKFITPKVKHINMVAIGYAASAGALIYVSVPKARRFCTPNTRFLIHEPSGGVGGQVTDINIQMDQLIEMRTRLNNIFAKATGKTLKQIEKDTERDFWMSAKEAADYGLVGKIVTDVRDLA